MLKFSADFDLQANVFDKVCERLPMISQCGEEEDVGSSTKAASTPDSGAVSKKYSKLQEDILFLRMLLDGTCRGRL